MRGLYLLPVLLLCQCGYFDSIVSPVESTPATLDGLVADSLFRKGLAEAVVILSGERDTFVMTEPDGRFRFPIATTGVKRLIVRLAGYADYEASVDLKKSGNELDTIFLGRRNSPPRVHKMLYPLHDARNVPLAVGFRWMAGDIDFNLATSAESLYYRFYFGDTLPPAPVDSGPLSISRLYADTMADGIGYHLINKPGFLFDSLSPNHKYFWQIVLSDRMGDTAIYGPDSFFTRNTFSYACPESMVLVERETLSFCIDKYEVTNESYMSWDTSYDVYQGGGYSIALTDPVVNVEYSKAEATCFKMYKRFCYVDEWKTASGGYQRLAYPYGGEYDSLKCHTNSEAHLGRVVPVGSMDSCVSVYGVYDLSGNVYEWVMTPLPEYGPEGEYRHFAGGAWYSKENSGTNTIERAVPVGDKGHHIGFRCCKDIQ